MKDTQAVRNFGIFGHGKCGKTSLAEALLFTSGRNKRLGKVDDGTAAMDFEPEEIDRKLSINAAFNRLCWNKHDLYFADTPGDANFINDTLFVSRVVDGAVFVIGAVDGVKNQTETFAEIIADAGLPAVIFINKMDRERADFAATVEAIRATLPLKTAVIHLPIGSEDHFTGVVDLISAKAYLFADNGTVTEAEIPAEFADEAATMRELLMEAVAETDDELIEQFLEEGELTEEEISAGLQRAVKQGAVCPVLAGAALANKGTALLLDAVNRYLPCPEEAPAREGRAPDGTDITREQTVDAPFSGLVFKTMADPYAGHLTIFRVFSGTLEGDSFYNASKEKMEKFGQILVPEGKEHSAVAGVSPGMFAAVAKLKNTATGDTLCDPAAPIIYPPPAPLRPVVSYAVSTTKKDDEDKVFSSITKMLDEDPTLRLERHEQTNEIVLSGMGQIHLAVVGEKIKRKFGVEMELALPKIPYKETVKGRAEVRYRHKKQSGGRGQFAENVLVIEPLPRGGGYEFVDKIVGGVIPKQFIPAVDKGVQEAMAGGVLAGYPMVDIRVSVVDGSFHTVDSSEMAFKISGSMAFKKGALEATPVLLEPIMEVTVRVPKDCVGDVIGDINSRRGRVMGMDSDAKLERINIQVPMAEILEYAPDLTSMTGGRGSFEMEFSHYEEVPANIADEIIAAAQKE